MQQSNQSKNFQSCDLLDLDAAEDPRQQVMQIPSQIQEQKIMIPTSIDFYNTIVINEFMNSRVVDLEDGDIISEGYLSKYKLYKVRTKKIDASEYDTEVSRRFSDFEWLYQELINKYGGYIIPALPEKHLLTKINFESYEVPIEFKRKFSEKRRKELQQFLQKVLNHRQIRYVPELRIFIEDREQFISLLKGELVQNKTIEQKYENIVSSLKGFFTNQTPTAIQNITIKTTDLVRTLDNSDKDLNNNEALLTNLSVKAEKLRKVFQEHSQSLKDDAKLLSEQQDLLIQWDGFGSQVEKGDLENFIQLVRYNSIKAKQLYRLTQEWESLLLLPLQQWLIDTDAALQACERRRNLIKELVIDQQRIEQLKLTYVELTSRRDIEMDILKTKYQKNKDKSEKMSQIMSQEIGDFARAAKERLLELLEVFKRINAENGRNMIKVSSQDFRNNNDSLIDS